MVALTSNLMRLSSVALAAFSTVNGQNITDDSYFYGQSPAVPAPQMPGTSTWKVARDKAVAFVSQMTLEEKANITVGYPSNTGCSGVTGSVPRLGWSGLCLSDAGNGLRGTNLVNAYAASNAVGQSWNRELTLQRGAHIGAEFRRKGVHVLLGPQVGPIGRVVLGGRNWEGFSVDPYHSGILVYDTIKGMQNSGVITSVKHFIGNEQERNRSPIAPQGSTAGIGGAGAVGGATPNAPTTNRTIEALSTNIDDKTMHELYMWPFYDAIRAGSASVMCSYQRINNSYGCHNQKAQNGLLKTELGFEGFIVTDWGALHTGVAAAEGGLDLAMPDGGRFWGVGGQNLTTMVRNGSLIESRLTDMATRIVAAWYQLGQDVGFPEIGMAPVIGGYNQSYTLVDGRDPTSRPVVLRGAIEGHVLVKNVNNALPLKKPRIVSLFGYDAATPPRVNLPDINENYQFGYLSNPDWFWRNSFARPPRNPGPIAPNGTLFTGAGAGSGAPAYIISPFDALNHRASQDGYQLFWDFFGTNPQVDQHSDVCLVFINSLGFESVDKEVLHDDFSDNIILNVASKCSNTMVIIHNAGTRLVDTWVDHPNITAVMYAHMPGQDSGTAVVNLLFGDESPSGKLTYTVAKNESEYNVPIAYPRDEYFFFPQDNFTEGVYIDYRDFDRKNITPRYEFGFGLTYTTFEYSDLQASFIQGVNLAYNAPAAPIVEGGQASLWDHIVTASAIVTNTGNFIAKEVAQLYVHIPGGPPRQLRGFDKVEIAPGESKTVTFNLMRRDLSEWNVVEQAWTLQRGEYPIWVGASSRILPLQTSLTLL